MQTITTKYLGPTNTRGARVKAKTTGGYARTLMWDYSGDAFDNHLRAARLVATELAWDGQWHLGNSHADGYTFVCSDEPAFTIAREA